MPSAQPPDNHNLPPDDDQAPARPVTDLAGVDLPFSGRKPAASPPPGPGPVPAPERKRDVSFEVAPPSPTPIQERRQQVDRREADRQGKYDRRKNRCGLCRFFQHKGASPQGYCQYHEQSMAPDAFACPFFHPVQPA